MAGKCILPRPTVITSAMATLSDRSGSLQDGTIISCDLLPSKKGTPLLVHPMLQPNIGSLEMPNSRGDRLCLPCYASPHNQHLCFFVYTQYRGWGRDQCPPPPPIRVVKLLSYSCKYSSFAFPSPYTTTEPHLFAN